MVFLVALFALLCYARIDEGVNMAVGEPGFTWLGNDIDTSK
jgi:hypothetical protein